jgi:hypothetical protein
MVNIVYGNLKSSIFCPETLTKLYVHEFGLGLKVDEA